MRVVHIAGYACRVGAVMRQRCEWCGALLDEVDLANTAVFPPPEPGEDIAKGFAPGSLVAVEGTNPVSYAVLPHTDGDQLPAGFCGDEGKPRLRAVESP